MRPFSCSGCEARSEALSAAERRETALLAQIQSLTSQLAEVAGARAHLPRPVPPPRTETPQPVRYPPYIQSLAGDHVNLREVRKRAQSGPAPEGLPPIARDET